MGTILRDDKVGALSESGGTITLAASILTIGGQQYHTDALNIAVPALSLNELAFVYATLSGGVPQLTIDTDINSIGPTGFDSWKLVGAYYSDDISGAFGTFVTVEGVPVSNWIRKSLTIKGTGGDPNPGTIAYDIFAYRRVGKQLEVQIDWKQQSAGSPGGGVYYFPLPTGLSYQPGILQGSPGDEEAGVVGSASIWDRGLGYLQMYNNDAISIVAHTASPGSWIQSGGIGALNNAPMIYSGHGHIPIAGWDNTPLKDL